MPILHPTSRRSLALAICAALLLGACASQDERLDPDAPLDYSKTDAQLQEEAAQAYVRARRSLDRRDFQTAQQMYSFISQRYPFTEFGTLAEMERIYALYRMYESERALSAADKFLREHPRHARVDYVQYLKGLINFNRERGVLGMLPVDDTKVDVGYDRAAFDDFALLVQRYPDSPYVGDARQRMVHLRNRIAQHEYAIAQFYLGRGAYVAAAERAERIIANYPGSPTSYEALALMEQSYRRAGLLAQADDAQRILQAQPIDVSDARRIKRGSSADQEPGLLARVGHALTFGLFEEDFETQTVPEDAAPPPAGDI